MGNSNKKEISSLLSSEYPQIIGVRRKDKCEDIGIPDNIFIAALNKKGEHLDYYYINGGKYDTKFSDWSEVQKKHQSLADSGKWVPMSAYDIQLLTGFCPDGNIPTKIDKMISNRFNTKQKSFYNAERLDMFHSMFTSHMLLK